MAAVLYQRCYARAQELRERLDRMRQWFEQNAERTDDHELAWRRDRFQAVQGEYGELLQIMRFYGKAPSAVGSARAGSGLDDLDADAV